MIRQLEAARSHLLARGDAEAVKSLDAIIDRLGKPEPVLEPAPKPETAHETDELITAQEAAEILGVNSVSPMWTFVESSHRPPARDGRCSGDGIPKRRTPGFPG